MRRQIKSLIAITAVTAVGLGIAGCSSPDSGGTADSGTVKLWVRDSQSRFIQQMVDTFNETHDTQVEVTLIPGPEYVQKFGTAVAGGDAPDIASIDLVYVPYFASVGALTDISDKWNTLPYKDDMSPAHVTQGAYDGGVYSIPFIADVSVMYYNKDLLKAAGLDADKPPATMAEVEATAKATTSTTDGTYGFMFAGPCGGCNIFSMTPFIWASGGDVLSTDGTEAKLDSQEVTDTLTMYRNMWEAGAMPALAQSSTAALAGDSFKQGKVALMNWSTFFLGALEDKASGVTFDWDVAPIPGAKAGQIGSFAGGDNLTIPSSAKNPTGAWEFLEWATGDEGQAFLAEKSVLPTRLDLIDSLYVSRDPRYQVFADALAIGRVPYSVIENQLFNDSNGVWSTMIQEAVFGPGSIEDAQATAQQEAQAMLDVAHGK